MRDINDTLPAAVGEDELTPGSPTIEEGVPEEQETPTESDADEVATDEGFVEGLAEKLTSVDAEKFAGLQDKFSTGDPFTKGEIKWIADNLGYDPKAVTHAIKLQQDKYRTDVATSVAAAEAEVGDLHELMSYAVEHARPDQLTQWQTVADYAHRTGNTDITMQVFRDLKTFKDNHRPGNRTTTLGHLAAGAGKPKPQPAPTPPPPPPAMSVPDPALVQLRAYSSQALAAQILNTNTDPAMRSRAEAVLKERGIL